MGVLALPTSDSTDKPFGHYEEEGIVSLILDFPELYISVHRFLVPELFSRPEVQYVIAAIRDDFDKFSIVPSRTLLWDRLAKALTVDDPYESILSLVKRPSNPREVPILRDELRNWAEYRTFDLLYSEEALAAHHAKDHETLRKIFRDAESIATVGKRGFNLFEQIDELFVENAVEHISTGFKKLDIHLNDGGPSPGEVVVWLAPTGVGKTLLLCNNAVSASRQGKKVLFVTFELSDLKTASRMVGAISGHELKDFIRSGRLDTRRPEDIEQSQNAVRQRVRGFRDRGAGDIIIYDLPPDECSVNNVYGLIETLKLQHGWKPDVVILDYLELMVSRRQTANSDDYTRQKSIATEVRGLARNEHVLIFTATQTNRGGVDSAGRRDTTTNHLNLDKTAESFGKTMPVDYVISLNQTEEEYNPEDGMPSVIRLWIAKNRNGRKFVSITTNVFYGRMQIKEPE